MPVSQLRIVSGWGSLRFVPATICSFLIALAVACSGGGEGESSEGPSPEPAATATLTATEPPQPTLTPDVTPSPEGTLLPDLTPPSNLTDVRKGALPDGFPENFPIPGEAEVIISGRLPSGTTEVFSVELEVEGVPDEVLQLYIELLQQEPWRVDNTLDFDDLWVVIYGNDEEEALSGLIVVERAPIRPGVSSVSLSVAIPPE